MKIEKCSECGASIVWADGAGGPVPLDAKAPVYKVTVSTGKPVATLAQDHRVSHFSTCPQASKFRKDPRG